MKIDYQKLLKLEQGSLIISRNLPDSPAWIDRAKSFEMLLNLIDLYFKLEYTNSNDSRFIMIENTLKNSGIFVD